MNQLGYLLPALIFFGVFFAAGKDFLKATAALMIVVTFQVILEKLNPIGDKIYGPDENLYLEFIEKGWTRHLEYNLPHYRQALHAAQLTIQGSGYEINFWAPFPQDLVNFCEKKMSVTISELQDFGIYLVNNLRSKKSSQQEVNRLPNIMPNVSTKYP